MSATRTLDRRGLAAAIITIVALSFALLLFAPAAKADTLTIAGGYTQLTTDPGTTAVLLKQRVTPLPIFPSWVVPVASDGKLALRYRFYITGGQIDGALAGEIYHSGGLRWVNLRNGKRFVIRNFTIDTANAQLTAAIPALGGARAPILDLDLSGVEVKPGSRYTKVGPVPATLTATAAGALNQYLGVSFFVEGIPLGTAYVYARFAQ